VEAIVLNIDAENQRLSLGLKQLATDIWDEFFAHHKAGDLVEGKVVRVTSFGAFVEIVEGIEGLVHVSEIDERRIEKPEEAVEVGKAYSMKIIKINEGEKKIGLSIKAVKHDEVQQDLSSYREQSTSESQPTTALADAFRAAQAARDRERDQDDK
jgi:small subunit ribosomal protein S1